MDDITPFGRSFLKADTYPAVQECYLRAMSVEQFAMPDGIHYFSPLRWLLAIMLELEKRTGSSELSRIEFALWGHTTNPSYNLEEVVDNILDLRQRRAAAPAKRPFDKKEIAKRGENYDKKADNFLDYSDMNMRYLRISGVLQRKGRGLVIVPTKHVLAEKLAKATASEDPLMEQYKLLCAGAPLPTDNADVAKSLLDDLIKQMKDRHIMFDISDLPLNTPAEINIARQRLENILAQTDEIQYANDQCNQWEEIRDYMTLLIKGGGKLVYDEDNACYEIMVYAGNYVVFLDLPDRVYYAYDASALGEAFLHYKEGYPNSKLLHRFADSPLITDAKGNYYDRTTAYKTANAIDRMEKEQTDKKKAEKELGHSVDYMAYPTGTYNLHIAEMVKEAGYKAAFTIKYGY